MLLHAALVFFAFNEVISTVTCTGCPKTGLCLEEFVTSVYDDVDRCYICGGVLVGV